MILQLQTTKPAVMKNKIIVMNLCKMLGRIVSRTHCAKVFMIASVMINIGDFVMVNQNQAGIHVFIREFQLLPTVRII